MHRGTCAVLIGQAWSFPPFGMAVMEGISENTVMAVDLL